MKVSVLCVLLGIFFFVWSGCKESDLKKKKKKLVLANSQALGITSRPSVAHPPTKGQIVQHLPKKKPVIVAVKRRIPPVIRWYKPRYRERRFYPPHQKLKQIPQVRAIPATIIQNGSRKNKMVALTFDACSWNSHPRFDRKVANILIRTKTPATLFVGGKWILKRKKDAKWLASFSFFEIANHTYLHGHLKRVSKKRLYRELKWTQEAIFTVLGVIPTLFRPPYVEYNQRVAKVAGKLGLKTIVGLSSGDPDPTFTKRVLVRYMKKAIKPGSIVVMHINKGGKHTAEALPDIIKNVKAKGYRLVTVSTMLNAQAFHK